MSYYSEVWGSISIEPPLRWEQFRSSPFYPQGDDACAPRDLMFIEDHEDVDTPDGKLHRITAIGVTNSGREGFDARTIHTQLQEIIDAAGPEHTFTGALGIRGEEWNDLWKLEVIDGKATCLVPTVTWPDGTVEVMKQHG